MIRTTITPSNNNIILTVPEKYVGKKIEVILFDVDEAEIGTIDIKTLVKPSQLRGFLSKDAAETMQINIQQSRNEWDTF